MADITSVRKKDSKSAKNNYRPISILSNISKSYERIMLKQMSEYFEICDGVVLEIYLEHKFQWPQEGLNCEFLAYEVVT